MNGPIILNWINNYLFLIFNNYKILFFNGNIRDLQNLRINNEIIRVIYGFGHIKCYIIHSNNLSRIERIIRFPLLPCFAMQFQHRLYSQVENS